MVVLVESNLFAEGLTLGIDCVEGQGLKDALAQGQESKDAPADGQGLKDVRTTRN